MAIEHEKEGDPVVEFLYLMTNEEKKFHVQWNNTLQQIWDQAYTELKEAKVAGDTLVIGACGKIPK